MNLGAQEAWGEEGASCLMAQDQIQINIPASDYARLRSALCRVGCGNTPNAHEAFLLHELMKILESAQGQLLGDSLPLPPINHAHLITRRLSLLSGPIPCTYLYLAGHQGVRASIDKA